ncbi:hypothetical protein CEXT_715341, partial [Caerostris extrusa]
ATLQHGSKGVSVFWLRSWKEIGSFAKLSGTKIVTEERHGIFEKEIELNCPTN